MLLAHFTPDSQTVFFYWKKSWLQNILHHLPHVWQMFPFATPLKTSENQRFPGVFRGHKMGILTRNRFIMLQKSYECLLEDSEEKS